MSASETESDVPDGVDEHLSLYTGSMASPEIHEICGGLCAVFSTCCPGSDGVSEDAALILPHDSGRSALLAVADGVGGAQFGGKAARLTVESLIKSTSKVPEETSDWRLPILDGIEKANHAVRALGNGAGTTIAVAAIQDRRVCTFHVGDSGVLLLGQKGKIKFQTLSHSPVGFAVEAGLLDADDAMHHEERHIVSNVIGASDMWIEVGPAKKLAAMDTLLLASDGLLDNLPLDEIVGIVRKGPIEEAADRLARETRHRMIQPRIGEASKPDDLTFIIFRNHVHRTHSIGKAFPRDGYLD